MIRILFLYHDLMNLYGDNGNIRVLERYLRDQGCEVKTDRRSLNDVFDLRDYDFIYCGCGTERNRNEALKDLLKHQNELAESYEKGTVILFTGISWQMLGKHIVTADNQKLDGIGLFDFTVTEQSKKRYTGDVLSRTDMFEEIFVGFINRCSRVEGLDEPFMKIEKVIGNIPDKTDGIHRKNLFGISLNGPVLVKNPHFARYIVRLLVKDYHEMDYYNERKSYETTIHELTEDREKHK
ncbi:MAG: hypothetical protein IIZ74_03070 [Erysipelotrichaceae bacterium]|nr:hypothetical protein [Erysipelotrichaceae bacterium]